MEIGITYHLDFSDGERIYFIPQMRLKNGRWRGVMYNSGAAGRSHKKGFSTTVNPDWGSYKVTPLAEIPVWVKAPIQWLFVKPARTTA